MPSHAETLGQAVATVVDALARAGVRHACACPGSRSTPLALGLARDDRIRLWMHLDERSAAYFGLGLAKALREPVVLLATSGTAAANFAPAVVEAFFARVPLVVLTADRPHELRELGAAQTIDQLHLYGRHAKWFVDLPEPTDAPDVPRYLRATAVRAVQTAREEPAGPVHLNWPFREPLVPVFGTLPPDRGGAAEAGRLAPAEATLDQLAQELRAAPRGLIVCGPQDDPDLPEALAALARRLGYPILADPLSGVRFGRHDRSMVIDAYDAFLRLPDTVAGLRPELVLRVGALPTSKPVLQFLERCTPPSARQVLVDPGGWRDPSSLASDVLRVDPSLLCRGLTPRIARPVDDDWLEMWRSTQHAARGAIDAHLNALDELFEGRVFAEVARLLPEEATLFAGNSMPVRDLDTFVGSTGARWRVLSNRGANGIDGVVSSALGASAALASSGSDAPTVLLIGDISFYHDLNGLLAAGRYGLDAIVVLLNNDGGGIFSFLPQAEQGDPERFERLFGTPHGLEFRPLVEAYGGWFASVRDWSDLRATFASALGRSGLRVLEVPTERERNVVLHRQVWQAVAAALAPVPA